MTRGREPLARLVQSALDAQGWKPAQAAEVTGLSRQHISQILSRRDRYTRPPKPETIQALAKIPGLSQYDVLSAVGTSIGVAGQDGQVFEVEWSANRRTVHNVVDKIPEDQLPRVLQILIAMLD